MSAFPRTPPQPAASSPFGSVVDVGPGAWGPEDDDWLHNPDKSDGVHVRPARPLSDPGPLLTAAPLVPASQHNYFSGRGIFNFATLGVLLGALLMLLCVLDRLARRRLSPSRAASRR